MTRVINNKLQDREIHLEAITRTKMLKIGLSLKESRMKINGGKNFKKKQLRVTPTVSQNCSFIK